VLILLEGSDRAGKSTLARHLRVRIQSSRPSHIVRVIHKGPPTAHPLLEYENPLFWYRPDENVHVICDRWHIGEQVYPQLLGRTTRATPAVNTHIEMFLRSRGALLVHVTAPLDTLAARLAAEQLENPGHSFVSAEQLVKSPALFENAVALSALDSVKIDTARQIYDGHLDTLIEKALRLEAEAKQIKPFRTYVGPPRPKLLLVGDVRHNYRDLRENPEVSAEAYSVFSPAFGPYPGTSGEFLLKSLVEVGVGDVGLVNANDVDDAELAYWALGAPTTVALGRKAWETASRWSVPPVGAVPHPQFVRRFAYRYSVAYGELIARTAAEGGNRLDWQPNENWQRPEKRTQAESERDE
jgi:thymidylate kinase